MPKIKVGVETNSAQRACRDSEMKGRTDGPIAKQARISGVSALRVQLRSKIGVLSRFTRYGGGPLGPG